MYKFLIAAFFAMFSFTASASDFPPNYTLKEECKTLGSVKVCATNRLAGGYPRFYVEYKGGMFDSSTEDLNVWIKFNGKTGTFAMERRWIYKDGQRQYATSFVSIGDAKNVHKCADKDSNTGRSPSPQFPLCPDAKSIPGGAIRWYAEAPSSAEKDLMFYARDDRGQGNAWDIEVAFLVKPDQWDSQNGSNYKFRF